MGNRFKTHRHTSLKIQTTPVNEDPTLSHARHLIRRLVNSGPAGFEQGATLLGQWATQAPIGDLMQIAAVRWRTQSEWATEASTNDQSKLD